MLDSISPVPNTDADRRRNLRLKAIDEIFSSEKAYQAQLDTLMTYFVTPLKEQNVIDSATHLSLFGQLEIICSLSKELVTELEEDLDNLAYGFIKLAPFFKLYSVYAFDYKNSLFTIEHLTAKNSVFRRFLERTESRPEVQTKLQSLLIAPIQRVPRYRLLLQQVLLYTSPADSDFKSLQDSIKQIGNTVQHIDSIIEDHENAQRLVNLQNSLSGKTPHIIKPSRKVVKEGILQKFSGNGTIKRYCILLSDIFMYCKVLKERAAGASVENSLECCCIFPLKKCKVTELFPGKFKITCQGDGIILSSDDVAVAKGWVKILQESIDLHIDFRKTLRKESSKRKPTRKREVKHFDNDVSALATKKYVS
jgi:RhoGEF domain